MLTSLSAPLSYKGLAHNRFTSMTGMHKAANQRTYRANCKYGMHFAIGRHSHPVTWMLRIQRGQFMRFKGSQEFEEFWGQLQDESSRGLSIVVAAFFDEKLGSMLGQPNGTFHSRINNALAAGVLTQNECHDLHVIRDLRNAFAHNLRDNYFDIPKSQKVDSLRLGGSP
jgi:hypothetical protein